MWLVHIRGVKIIPQKRKPSEILKKCVDEYRLTLKPRESEELINQFINRPAAFAVAKLFFKLKGHPNLVTIISMIFGVSSGYFFAKGEYPWVLLAGILLEFMIIFDCADGQLARLTGMSSDFGKTIDGLADIGTHFSIFYGVALALYRESGSISPFLMAVISQVSMYLHIMLYDHFKNVFISVTKPGYFDKLESIEGLKARVSQNIEQGNRIKIATSKLYYLFYKLELLIVSIGYLPAANNFYELCPDPERIGSHTRDLFYREMRVSVKLWSFIGDTTHLTIFVLFGVLNRIDLIWPVILYGTNGMMVLALLYHRVKFKSLGIEREILWQERFD